MINSGALEVLVQQKNRVLDDVMFSSLNKWEDVLAFFRSLGEEDFKNLDEYGKSYSSYNSDPKWIGKLTQILRDHSDKTEKISAYCNKYYGVEAFDSPEFMDVIGAAGADSGAEA